MPLHPQNVVVPGGLVRVLVVDDDALQLRALQRAMRSKKHVAIVIAANAIDAVLHVGGSKPDVVIMDIFMPGLDGLEACRRIKANPETRDVEGILASAGMNSDLEERARIAGARRAVAKPLDLMKLLDERAAASPEVLVPIE